MKGISWSLRHSIVVSMATVLVACSGEMGPIDTDATSPSPSDEPSPATAFEPAGTIVSEIPVPNDGIVAFGAGAVWVDDRRGGEVTDGIPNGVLHRIDPSTERVTARIPGVAGGCGAVGHGALWLCTLAGDLDVLTRVDLETHDVVMVKSVSGRDPGPEGVAVVDGGVWVAHSHAGSVTRIDPRTLRVTATIEAAEGGSHGPQGSTTDGSTIWLSIPRVPEVIRIDPARRRVASRIGLPHELAGAAGMTADETTLWVTNGPDGPGRHIVYRINAETEELEASIEVVGTAESAAIGFGAVWILTQEPAALVRIDPATNTVTGSVELPSRPWDLGGIAIGDGSIWVRVPGRVLRVRPA